MKTGTQSWRAVLTYILFIFLLAGASLVVPANAAYSYTSLEVFVIGLAAIVWQKWLHRDRIANMGFHLNRNVVVGLGVAAAFAAIQFVLTFWLPMQAGVMEITASEKWVASSHGMSPFASALLLLVVGGLLLFLAAFFGEELAFRGYLLPKLNELYGAWRAIFLCAAIFGLWHLPAYFTVYVGGAAEEGWCGVALMLLVHAVSSIPVCTLYLTTRELYSVSMYHALVDVTQYAIVGNAAMGKAAEDAVYNVNVVNDSAAGIISLAWLACAIPIMMCLCRAAKRMLVASDSGP
jgi:membrane protease YdiL (CAAX protease family)